jgi:hypothetical protein
MSVQALVCGKNDSALLNRRNYLLRKTVDHHNAFETKETNTAKQESFNSQKYHRTVSDSNQGTPELLFFSLHLQIFFRYNATIICCWKLPE